MQTPCFLVATISICAAVCHSSLCEDEFILVALFKNTQQKLQACVTDKLFIAFNVC